MLWTQELSELWAKQCGNKKVGTMQKVNQNHYYKALIPNTKMKATLKINYTPFFSWQELAQETLKARDEEKIRKEGEAFCKQVFSEVVNSKSKLSQIYCVYLYYKILLLLSTYEF